MTALDSRPARSPAVGLAQPEQMPQVLAALTLAFAGDPAVRWLFSDASAHLRHFARFARALGGAAFRDRTVWVDDASAGAALWLAPDSHPDEAALLALIEEAVPRGDRESALAVFDEMARHHPAEPHWYLPLIGVEPASQGRGIGAALLGAMLAECDATNLPAYLESTNPRNRPLYERHGFVAVGEIRIGACPPITPMLRRPQG